MYKRRINVRGIIFHENKILVQRLRRGDGEYDFWSTPGGGLDDGENLIDGLHREMIEETGIAPVIGKLLFVQQFHDGEKEQLEFFFHIENSQDYLEIDLESTSHGMEEVSRVEFIDAATERILPEFLTEIDIKPHLTGAKPVLVMSELSA